MEQRTDIGFTTDPAGEFPFEIEHYLFHLLVALNRLRDAQLERDLRAIGSSLAWHRAMTVILRFGPCSMSELADFSLVDRTTLTRTVDQLVKEGLVLRQNSDRDRRQVLLTLTAAGEAASAASREVVGRHNLDVVNGVPNELLRAMVRAQQLLVSNLAANPAAAHRQLTLSRLESETGSSS